MITTAQGAEVHFKGAEVEAFWPSSHPDLRTLICEFANFSKRQSLPPPVITELGRSRARQRAIYLKRFGKLLDGLAPGERRHMIDPEDDGTWRRFNEEDLQEAQRLSALVASGLRHGKSVLGVLEELADNRFTWHWVNAAADLRTTGGGGHYTPAQLEIVTAFFEARCKKPNWEFKKHDTAGPHIHIGRRDLGWKERYSGPAS